MGEANPEALEMIARLTGHEAESGMTPDGTQFLRIGDIVLKAAYFALWSDPSVYDFGDRIAINWGGTDVSIPMRREASTERD